MSMRVFRGNPLLEEYWRRMLLAPPCGEAMLLAPSYPGDPRRAEVWFRCGDSMQWDQAAEGALGMTVLADKVASHRCTKLVLDELLSGD